MSDSNKSFSTVLAVVLLGTFFTTSAMIIESLKQKKATIGELSPATQQEASTPLTIILGQATTNTPVD